MDKLIYILVGIINGIFSSGAGQILLFYWIYILKKDSKTSRDISLIIMPLISIPTMIFYMSKIQIEWIKIVLLIAISIIFSIIGNKVMKKFNDNILNLISGIFLVVITSISLWRIK